LICTSLLRLLVRALDDHARAAAAVGVLHLRAEFAGAEIEFGADAGRPQGRGHALVVGEAVAVEHRHDDGAGFGLRIDLAEMHQRCEQARHADGEAGRRHRLTAKARDEAVIAAAAADGAEAQ
jgi:hypothetical protein